MSHKLNLRSMESPIAQQALQNIDVVGVIAHSFVTGAQYVTTGLAGGGDDLGYEGWHFKYTDDTRLAMRAHNFSAEPSLAVCVEGPDCNWGKPTTKVPDWHRLQNLSQVFEHANVRSFLACGGYRADHMSENALVLDMGDGDFARKSVGLFAMAYPKRAASVLSNPGDMRANDEWLLYMTAVFWHMRAFAQDKGIDLRGGERKLATPFPLSIRSVITSSQNMRRIPAFIRESAAKNWRAQEGVLEAMLPFMDDEQKSRLMRESIQKLAAQPMLARYANTRLSVLLSPDTRPKLRVV